MRNLHGAAERKRSQFHLLLHRFLPGLIKLLAHLQVRHDFKFRLDLRHLRDRCRQKSYFTRHGMEKTHTDIYQGVLRFVAHETLGLHDKWLRAILRDAVIRWINAPESETLAILLRRRAIRIKDIALVEDGVDHFLDQFPIHAGNSVFPVVAAMGSEASNRSIVCSQLETPTRRRY